MTISNEDIRTEATATSGQTNFTFSFVVYDADDVRVFVDDVEQLSGFTVTLTTPASLPSAGEVDFSPDPGFTGGESVVMVVDADYHQDTDINNAGSLAESFVEVGLDKIVRMLHQLVDALARAPKFSLGSTTRDKTFPEPSDGSFIGWAGTALTNKSSIAGGDPVTILGDEEVLAQVTGGSPDGIVIPTHSILYRAGGSLDSLTFSASRMLGRGASGALKAMTPAEIRALLNTLDEDDMASDSAAALATQQSIKAYVDSRIAFEGVQDATNGGADDLTEVTFLNIPAAAKRITIFFDEISVSGTSRLLLGRIGDSGGFETTGYVSSSAILQSGFSVAATTATDSFVVENIGIGEVYAGSMVLTKMNTGNIWIAHHIFGSGASTALIVSGGGRKALSGTLDRVGVFVSGGSNTFDNGQFQCMVEV